MLKISRSSVASTAFVGVPSTATLCSLSTPARSSDSPTLSAVCPPMLMRMPSGRSLRITSATKSCVTGRKYTLSAMPFEV